MDKNRKLLQETINKAVRKALLEQRKQEKTLDTIIENVVSKKLQMLREDDVETENKRNVVLSWLRQDTVNVAAIRRELEGEPETQEEEDAKRSYFMKKVHGTDDKKFNDNEINSLYAIKSRLGQ